MKKKYVKIILLSLLSIAVLFGIYVLYIGFIMTTIMTGDQSLKDVNRKYTIKFKDSAVIHIYNGLESSESIIIVDIGYEKHLRVNHSKNEFAVDNKNHINGIESFWGYAKHRLYKFKGIPKEKFELYFKETEYKFNHRGQDLYTKKSIRELLNAINRLY